jgi:hypothetical protein
MAMRAMHVPGDCFGCTRLAIFSDSWTFAVIVHDQQVRKVPQSAPFLTNHTMQTTCN